MTEKKANIDMAENVITLEKFNNDIKEIQDMISSYENSGCVLLKEAYEEYCKNIEVLKRIFG